MKKLKTTFEELGFTNVVTYINSGNIIFEAKGKKEDRIVNEIELGIKKDFALEIKVLIRNLESIKTLCKKIPNNWVKNETMRTDVMFLWEEFYNPKILDELKINPVDNVKYLPGAVVWNINTLRKIFFVIALEAINSAIENMTDFVSLEKNEQIKKIKDLSAGAVLVSAITAVAIGLIVFIPKLFTL